MRCPFCRAAETKVTDSRFVSEGDQVRRRRECTVCVERFTTYETTELSFPRIVKRDGSRVQFRIEKLKSGMLRALEKRPVSTEAVDKSINRILFRLHSLGERELETKLLGEWVMTELQNLDEIAYVRFASVYRRFQDIQEFNREIARLKQEEKQNA
jgi:transcriptional repressor NrdR